MNMPTPCQHCGEWFDLNNGWPSEKWNKGITICASCHEAEETEIEHDNRDVKCNRCRNVHSLADRVRKQNKKDRCIFDLVCPRCESKVYVECE